MSDEGDRQHLEGLLRQLRRALKEATSEIDYYKNESANFEKNMLKNQREVETMTANYNSLKRELERLQEDKLASDRKNEATIAEWRRQVTRQAKEFDELKGDLVPKRDLEMERARILETLEGTYAPKMNQLEDEVARLRSINNKERSENDELKAVLKRHQAENDRVMDEMVVEHGQIVKELEGRLITLQAAYDANIGGDKVDKMKKEMDVLKHQNDLLHQESEEMRARKEQLSVQLDTERRQYDKEKSELAADVKSKESLRASLARKAQNLETEIDSLHAEIRMLKSSKDALATDLQTAEENANKMRDEAVNVRRQFDTDLERQRQKAESARQAAALDNQSLRQQIEALQMRVDQLENEMADKDRELGHFREEESHFRTVEEQLASKNREIDQLQETIRNNVAKSLQHEEEKNSMRQEYETKLNDSRAAVAEVAAKEELVESLRESLKRSEEENLRVSREFESRVTEISSLDQRYRELLGKHHADSAELERLKITMQSTEEELKDANARHDREVSKLKKRLQLSEGDMQARLKDLKDKVEEIEIQKRERNAKLSRTSEKYKKLKKRYDEVGKRHEQALRQQKSQSEEVRQSLVIENDRKDRQIKELTKDKHKLEAEVEELQDNSRRAMMQRTMTTAVANEAKQLRQKAAAVV